MSVRRSWPTPSRRWLTCWRAAVLLLASATAAVACPLCYEAARQMVIGGQQLDMADRVVLAEPIGNAKRFRVVEVIKGHDALGEFITDPVMGLDAAVPVGCDPCLLVHDPVAAQWTAVGTMRAGYADWLRQL